MAVGAGVLFHSALFDRGWQLVPPFLLPQLLQGFTGNVLSVAGGRTKLGAQHTARDSRKSPYQHFSLWQALLPLIWMEQTNRKGG